MLAELRPEPRDTISSICFSPNHAKNVLAASSWDNMLRVYDVDNSDLISQHEFQAAPLDCCFLSDFNRVAAGGLTGGVHVFDVHGAKISQVGRHDAAVRCVRFHRPTNLIYSGGWDNTVRAWDLRSPREVGMAALHGKVYAMDLNDDKLVVCDSKKRTYIYDIRNGANLVNAEYRDQILKYQIRVVRCFPNGQGFAASSIEGRVSWEYFDPNPEVQSRKYAFKCHRIKEADGSETACPVNAIVFHPRYGTFATGGSDGGVSIWDGLSKKRLCRVPPLPTSVSSLAFNSSGTLLAMAVSYMFERGPQPGQPKPQIIVRAVREEDVRPKS
ncbi:mitotic checkpoint protein bub3, putative [Eimeria necatrix]|uniref:Mitotic checkpoint protein bub3, putative n=1 Tax=Eimeria necatrix TaxID=51315 RepID=U6ML79_9EIME|nr:mitotic checkpoint protein bub3, putative [Eimeria necatrix]CDJ63828.1 mitotic checkpoint protein bub3, putative [Eimeria necatrix]